MAKIVELIYRKRSNTKELAQKLQEPEGTVDRSIRHLKKRGLIKFEGAPKTGGYILTEYTQELIKK